MKTCNCPNCGAQLNIGDDNRDFAFCQYCGAKLVLDDYRSTQRIIDEARIKQVEADREIRLRELEMQEKKEKQKDSTRKLLIKIWIASIFVILILDYSWHSFESG